MEFISEPVVIGVVVAPHGVRGTVKVKVIGSGRHLRYGVSPVVNGERRRILWSRETPKGFLVSLEGIRDRNLAAALRGSELLLDREELDMPEENEFYVGDLVGLEAYDGSGTYIGSVADVLQTSVHEILVIRDDLDVEHYIPFTFENVRTVDLAKGCIMVNPLHW
ncbi:MAG: ribosome maturation factor RimM [Actinomycetota bacterium]|nr:ribosome maturation factor RimM [Actinomycetota bacterium]